MDLKLLQDMSSKKIFWDGQVIVNEGDAIGNEMYIILSGVVVVYRNHKTPDEVQLAELSAGNFFGEMTLFLNQNRTSTVVARGAVILLEINRMNAYEFFEKQPQATYALIRNLCARLVEANDGNVQKLTGKPVPEKTETDKGADSIKPAKPAVAEPPPAVINPHNIDVSLDLFPENHKVYSLEIQKPSNKAIAKKTFSCPVCDSKFSAMTARVMNLRMDRIDKDFRAHYNNNIDVIHYDIITCPDCYYSTFSQSFASPVIAALLKNINQVKMYKEKLTLSFEDDREINNIFAGYYLSLISGPSYFLRFETSTAKAWLRLMWLYQDVGDKEMELYATRKAYDAYLDVFQNSDFGSDAVQQINMTLGELCLKLGDLDAAKKFYFQVKTSRSAKAVIVKQADERLNELREMEKA